MIRLTRRACTDDPIIEFRGTGLDLSSSARRDLSARILVAGNADRGPGWRSRHPAGACVDDRGAHLGGVAGHRPRAVSPAADAVLDRHERCVSEGAVFLRRGFVAAPAGRRRADRRAADPVARVPVSVRDLPGVPLLSMGRAPARNRAPCDRPRAAPLDRSAARPRPPAAARSLADVMAAFPADPRIGYGYACKRRSVTARHDRPDLLLL